MGSLGGALLRNVERVPRLEGSEGSTTAQSMELAFSRPLQVHLGAGVKWMVAREGAQTGLIRCKEEDLLRAGELRHAGHQRTSDVTDTNAGSTRGRVLS